MVSKLRAAVSVILLGLLGFLLVRLDLGKVYAQMVKANKLYLAVAIAVIVMMILVKIAKFSLIGRYYNQHISFPQAALVQMVGIALATLTPGRVGEGSKVILLKKHLKIPVLTSTSIVVLERLLDIIILSAGAFLLSVYIARNMVLFTGILFFLLVAVLVIFLRFPNAVQRFIPGKFSKDLSVEIKNDRVLFLFIFVSSFVGWALEAVFHYFVLRSFGTQLALYIIFGIVCISTISVFFSVLPAGLGSVDLSYLLLYQLVGVPLEVAASTLLIYRFFSILSPFLSVGLILNYYRLSPGDIRREIKG